MHKPSFAAAVMFLLLSPIVPSWATPSPAAPADSPPPSLDAAVAGADDDRWQTGPITLLLDAAITLELPEGYRYLSPADYAKRAGVAFSPGMPGLIHLRCAVRRGSSDPESCSRVHAAAGSMHIKRLSSVSACVRTPPCH